MFFGSPPPMKKWHLSAHAPQRTQTSMNTLKERYLSRRSRIPSMMISFQFEGSFQSGSVGDHSRAFGKPMYWRFFGLAGQMKLPGRNAAGSLIQSPSGVRP